MDEHRQNMQEDRDTIVALSTPPGKGAIAIVRLSGPASFSIVQKVKQGKSSLQDRVASVAWLIDDKEPIDEVVILPFSGPDSYTGEDVIEINCHGGSFIAGRIVSLMINEGARLAEPGEFTQRAFLYGKMDLAQAEAVSDLIHSETEAARRVAVYQLEGRLSDKLKAIRTRLIETCSLLEIELDFSEEDLEFTSSKSLEEMIHKIESDLTNLLGSFKRGKVCRDGIRMAIVGRPNVGKSSILNSLVEKERAIVTETPGTTRDTIEEQLDIEGVLFIVIDTAGIRRARNPVEKEGIRRAEDAMDRADLILAIFDGSLKMQQDDEAVIKKTLEAQKLCLAVINKTDLSRKLDAQKLKRTLHGISIVDVSAKTQEGMMDLILALKEQVLGRIPHEGEVIITSIRHQTLIKSALDHLKNADESLKNGMSQEFLALDLRGAMEKLGAVTGDNVDGEILNHIFSTFCIGK